MNKFFKICYLLILCLVISLPLASSAASLFFDSTGGTISAGDSIIINVRLNTESASINTVDGEIALALNGKRLTIREFSLANSALAIWPLRPSLSQDGKSISFVGGLPGGLVATDAVLFKIVLTPEEAGDLFINPVTFSAYLNDGKGTPVSVSKQALTISVAKPVKGSLPKDNWQDLLVADNTPPEPFVINLYQDPETNDGQKFIDFYATDNQTGVAYYEVLEGDLAPVRSGSPYTLQNQLAPLPLKISVIAHDKAGNLRTVAYTADEDKPSALTDITNNITSAIDEGSPLVGRIIIVGSLLLIIAIAWLIICFIISSKHKKQQPNHDKDK